MDFAGRLKQALGDVSVYAFAKTAGVDESLLRRYLAGKAAPGLDNLVALAKAGGVRVEWLTTGEGEMKPRIVDLHVGPKTNFTPFAWAAMEEGIGGGIPDDLGAVEVRLIDPDAPREVPSSSKRPLGAIVPVSTLGRLGSLHERLVALVARAALAPSIDAGDRLVIDLMKSKPPLAEGTYLFVAGGELLLRRLEKRTDGQLVVTSAESSRVLSKADLENVIGRVVWRSGKV